MPSLREEAPESLPQYLALVEELQGGAEESLWYRGCGKCSYTLLPTLYRHRDARTPHQLADLEHKLITRFKQRSLPYHTRPLSDDWDTIFFMQHYGVPTRLLDWTENPLIGLHFALMSAPWARNARGRVSFEEAAAVWVLDPVRWNRHALRHHSFAGGPLTPGEEELKSYKPMLDFSIMNGHPVALYGAHNSPRIVAQQGVFTIFGQSTAPMEKAFAQDGFPDASLVRIVIKRSAIPKMRKSLLNHGITETVVLPDLDGLAREIRRAYGFEV